MKLAVVAFLVAVAASTHAAEPTREAAATIVVFNENDPDSRELARYYAEKRAVPEANIIGLKCSTNEEISRGEFDRDIAEPLRTLFVEKAWWKLRGETSPFGRVESSRIRFVALMRGIPLKIAHQSEPYEGDDRNGAPQVMSHNEAAVDSELAVLGVHTRRISGALSNPYFRSYQRITQGSAASLLLVCRLDGPTPAIVRRMIDDSLAAEARGLRGIAYIDGRGTTDPQLIEGDKWLLNAATTARRKGMPVIMDTGAGLYPESYPMTHAAIYLGWYTQDVVGPFVRPSFRFEPGAVAAHLHSFSGSTLRDTRKFWCGPLLAAGAAATLGNVYEPYLGFTPNFDVFYDRLRAGFTFAESGYMSQKMLSWMTTFVGDPLYQPFKGDELNTSDAAGDEWDAYARGARVWFEQGPEKGTAELRKLAKESGSGVVLEGLGLLQLTLDRFADAAVTFEDAAKAYKDPADILRATIHEVFQLRTLKRRDEALKLARERSAEFPEAPGAQVLRDLAAQMAETSKKP